MLYALLFLPALVAGAFVLLRPRRTRVLAESAPPARRSAATPSHPMLDALLAELRVETVVASLR
jgi:hypothetical protein